MFTEKLLTKYYFDKVNWKDGTTEYHELLKKHIHASHRILELGSGPSNRTTRLLKELGQQVIGLDIDQRVLNNDYLDEKFVYDGKEFPTALKETKFDIITCDYVMEHVEFPKIMLKEISNCLEENGLFIFRTPNRYHYVSLISALTPQWFHLLVANHVRKTPPDQVDPYPTYYRFNSQSRVKKILRLNYIRVESISFVEKEPSYLKFNVILFFLGIAFERLVNSSNFFNQLRANIFVVAKKNS